MYSHTMYVFKQIKFYKSINLLKDYLKWIFIHVNTNRGEKKNSTRDHYLHTRVQQCMQTSTQNFGQMLPKKKA